jgi:hypothetical protein
MAGMTAMATVNHVRTTAKSHQQIKQACEQ